MAKSRLVKPALVGALLGAFLIGGARDVYAFGFLAFGILNVLVSAPGTEWVRGAAVAMTLGALAWPTDARLALMLLAWLVWIPAFASAWATAREIESTPHIDHSEVPASGRRARVAVSAVIGAVALASLAYKVIAAQGLQQTAALFMGIPVLLAIVVVLSVSPRTAIGVVFKAVTVGLLVSLVFLGEGILCVAMSAPLFYAVAVIVTAIVERIRRGLGGRAQTTYSIAALLIFVPLSLEGVFEGGSLNRDEWISETRILRAPSHAVERAIFEPPRFERTLPAYLRLGFPRPISTRIVQSGGSGQWTVRFRGGEMRLDGVEPRAGDLVLALEESRPGVVRWRAVSDDSHMTHFLSWRESRVQWEALGPDTTRVTWTLRYRRGLDPSWYFGPWERYAARLAAGYLIDSVATP